VSYNPFSRNMRQGSLYLLRAALRSCDHPPGPGAWPKYHCGHLPTAHGRGTVTAPTIVTYSGRGHHDSLVSTGYVTSMRNQRWHYKSLSPRWTSVEESDAHFRCAYDPLALSRKSPTLNRARILLSGIKEGNHDRFLVLPAPTFAGRVHRCRNEVR